MAGCVNAHVRICFATEGGSVRAQASGAHKVRRGARAMILSTRYVHQKQGLGEARPPRAPQAPQPWRATGAARRRRAPSRPAQPGPGAKRGVPPGPPRLRLPRPARRFLRLHPALRAEPVSSGADHGVCDCLRKTYLAAREGYDALRHRCPARARGTLQCSRAWDSQAPARQLSTASRAAAQVPSSANTGTPQANQQRSKRLRRGVTDSALLQAHCRRYRTVLKVHRANAGCM